MNLQLQVKEVTLMKADGDVITVSRETDERTFLAACVSLGALGVILSVKIQCESAFHLEQIRYGAKRKKVHEKLRICTIILLNRYQYFVKLQVKCGKTVSML